MTIEVTVADQRGLNVPMLAAAIEHWYVTPAGARVHVKVGRGLHIDGVPQGTLRLVDAE